MPTLILSREDYACTIGPGSAAVLLSFNGKPHIPSELRTAYLVLQTIRHDPERAFGPDHHGSLRRFVALAAPHLFTETAPPWLPLRRRFAISSAARACRTTHMLLVVNGATHTKRGPRTMFPESLGPDLTARLIEWTEAEEVAHAELRRLVKLAADV